MKSIRFVFFYLIAPILVFSACNDDDKTVNAEIILSRSEIIVPQAASSTIFYIKSSVDWTLTGTTDWCTVTPTTGIAGETTKLTMTTVENNTTDERIAQLSISGGGEVESLTIVQSLNLLATTTSYQAKPEGEVINVVFKNDGTSYTVTSNNSWIKHQTGTRTVSDKTESFVITPNYSGSKRTGSVTIATSKVEEIITFEQEALNIPASDQTGMNSNALELAAKINIGWNLGNTLEASGNETAWGNPKTTQAIIDMVKEAGFNAVRIPCNWMSGYVEDEISCQIKTEWMERVKEVVDYCVDRDMYAIINIHWDGGWLEENPTYAAQTEVNRKQALLWNQIATYFRDYDERLLFSGTNEVHVEGVYNDNLVTAENHTVQQSFNQTFVDAVRATGGRNAYRNLIVQSYNTQINFAVNNLKMPTDNVNDRLMLEVHFYDPYNYTIASENIVNYWGKPWSDRGFTVDTWGQEDHVDSSFASIKKNFTDKGIPTILGEFGANRHSVTDSEIIKSRQYWLEYITTAAKNNGMVPFYWDNGGVDGDAGINQMALFNRKQLRVIDQAGLDALMKGAAAGKYPF